MQTYAVIHQIMPAFLPTVSAHNVSAMMVVVAIDRITVSFIGRFPIGLVMLGMFGLGVCRHNV
jgi:hypothetical protein